MTTPRSGFDPTRREFLALLPLAAAAATACRGARYDRAAFALPIRSEVALLSTPDYGPRLVDAVSRGIDLVRPDVRGRRVLLKPNLVEYESGSMINTHPVVVAAAAEAFRRAGAARVVIAEGPGHRRDTEYLLDASGLSPFLKDVRAPFVDLNLDDVRQVPLRSWYTGLRDLMLPVSILDSDFVVSLAKLKTHHWAGMTAAMKNLFGVVPGAVYGWPKNILHIKGIEASIVDLNATVRPSFAIVDAVVAMEGDGPIMGTPKPCGFLAMGTDPVAVDATCARIMGLEPLRLGYIRDAARFLGNADPERIVHRGENPARFETRFELIERMRGLRRRD